MEMLERPHLQERRREALYMKYPIGVSDFKKLIEGEYLFADKSLFIKDIVDDSPEVIVITRPRRFGKTLNLSMLNYFFGLNHSENKNLFEGLNISKDVQFCKKHQQQYPVIFISFKDIKASNYVNARSEIVELVRKLYASNAYLLEGDVLLESERRIFNAILNKEADESDIQASISQLSAYMTKKFKTSPIILIDEYDTPIQEAYLRNYYEEMIVLMRGILGRTLKDNNKFIKAVVTGITRIAQESLFSGLNNIKVYSLLQEEYGQYFGLTEEEVLKLLGQSKQKASIEAIKEWYNGYVVGQYTLYNPWSIINCLDNDKPLQPYWINTASNDLLAELLGRAKPVVKQQLEELLQGNVIEQPVSENIVFSDIKVNTEALWSLLLYAGYLKVLSVERRGSRLITKLAIPNKEVSFVYDGIVERWFSNAISMDSYDKFVRSLADKQLDVFKEYLASYIMQTSSYFDFNHKTAEQVFHVFILGLVVGLRDQYYIYSNQESGLGRFDVIFIPKNKQKSGILLEFKTSPTPELLLSKAQEALGQIKDRKYVETFKQHNVGSILAIGLAFCGKELEMVYEEMPVI